MSNIITGTIDELSYHLSVIVSKFNELFAHHPKWKTCTRYNYEIVSEKKGQKLVKLTPLNWPKDSFIMIRFLQERDKSWIPHNGSLFAGFVTNISLTFRRSHDGQILAEDSPSAEVFQKARALVRPFTIVVENSEEKIKLI